jgi:hypothetical protein
MNLTIVGIALSWILLKSPNDVYYRKVLLYFTYFSRIKMHEERRSNEH